MFANIPRKLGAPFGLLGDEAKLAFRSQPGGIVKLSSTRNIPQNDSYWDQYITLFDSASDVFSLISPHDIRRALLEAPENVATLIRVISARLFNLVSDHTFPTVPNSSVTSYASSFIKSSTGSPERNPTKEVLNCIRVLQRVLPVVFEVEGETSLFELEIFWKQEKLPEDFEANEDKQAPQFVIEDEEESDDAPGAPESSKSASQDPIDPKKGRPPLGERILCCLVDLLFCCGFTLPTKIQIDHYKINYIIWEKGVGSTNDPGPNHAYDSNKTEVLRLLLVFLSRQIYIPPSQLFIKPCLYTLHLVQKRSRRDVLTLLCSLLNTAMKAGQPLGNTIGGMAGKIPYNHLVFKGEDPRTTLVGISFQVLCVLLDFQSGSARDVVSGSGDAQTSAPTAQTNAFRYFLMKLHRTQDFVFIVEGIAGILEQQMAAMYNLLPGAKKSIPHVFENLIFFWKMIELNKKFRACVLESERATDILTCLLCYFLEIKDKPQQHGVCRALSYILQSLSAEPAFGPKLLSSPVSVQLPSKWNAVGTVIDLMISAIHTITTTNASSHNPLYPALIIALANAAPYFKNLSPATSTKLIQIFATFSNPAFLLADEGHPRLLFFMLEVFNSIVYHNLSENANLVYGVLFAHKTFEDLGTFTLASGLREIQMAEISKDEQAAKSKGKLKMPSSSEDAAAEPLDEKARLAETQSAADIDLEIGRNPLSQPLDPLDGSQQSDDTRPVTSSTVDSPTPTSTKARGKMKARPSISLDNLDRIAAAGVGKNGFVPTEEWVASWQQGLPLDTIMIVISELLPKVQELQSIHHKPKPSPASLDFLRRATLRHVLPPVPPLGPRKFQWSEASMVWLTSLIWGEVYVRGMTPLAVWNATNVRLFHVKHKQVQQRQIAETVSNVVGGFLGRSSSSDLPGPGRQRQDRT